jgi:hypothetical protein
MPTIDHALQRFLEREREQHPDEMDDLELVVDNLRSYLDSYGYQYADDDPDDEDDDFDEDDYDEDEDDFGLTHDAEMLPVATPEFLYSWYIRKFIGTADDARAAGVAVARLMELLAEEGWADRREANAAAELSRLAADELPRAKELSSLLYDVAAATPPARADDIDDDIDDFLTIARIEPGRLWFSEDVGPVEVPEEASRLAQVGWWVNLAAQRRGDAWFITETGYVYPRMIEDEDDDGTDSGWAGLFPGSPGSLN